MFSSFSDIVLLVIALFFLILVALEVGRRVGLRRRASDPDGGGAGAGAVDGAIFGLMGLLIAFTFSGAASRFEKRRDLTVEEANIIGTTYLRLDLLPVSEQPALRDAFRRYVDARLAIYNAFPDVQLARIRLKEADAIQGEIWSKTVAATRVPGMAPPSISLVISSLNEMIDISMVRTVAMQTHLPPLLLGMLILMVLAGSVLAGFGMSGRKRSLLHMIGFAFLITIAIYVILDLEYPRVGLIRIDAIDRVLVDVRNSMN